MSLKDIEKLKERVDRDPNSKLFVPLAEEYKKEGLLDEAISVLLGGIERQPGYMSARVSLGKIYLDKGMLNEARAEFENVIKSIPDNLYAHKKLAEIYRDMGEKTLSVRSYKAVLSLNALDDDAISNLRDLEGFEEEIEQIETAHEIGGGHDAAVPPAFQGDTGGHAAAEAEPFSQMTLPRHTVDELDAFKDSIFGDKSAEAVDITGNETGEEEAIEIVEDDAQEEEVSFEDINETVLADVPLRAGVTADADENIKAARYGEEEKAEGVSPEPLAASTGPEDADGLIVAGNYLGAMNAYRKMLSADPNDRAVLQRVEELRVLLRLMGKDKETLISKLDDFLEGIRRRRDDFHGSS
jgi:tetratricopeptide (TPR) repeat protein